MSDPVYKKIEIVGTSSVSVEDAIANGVAAVVKTVDGKADWFEVQEVRGHITNGKPSQYQVVLKVGVHIA
ncbi:MAG: dodecin [Rhodospirillaceae bacterium]